MPNIKLADAQKALQAIANQKGRSGYEAAKSAYMADKLVVDDNDVPVDSVDFEAVFKDAPDPTVTKAAYESAATDIDTLRNAIRAELGDTKTVAKGVRIESDDRRPHVARGRTRYIKSSGNAAQDSEKAHDFGRWLQAITFGDKAQGAATYCRKKGFGIEFGEFDANDRFVQKSITGHSESVNVDGGFLVPTEFDNEILWLREQYGVIRRRARRKPMKSDVLSYSRKTGSHTAYYNNEGATNTTTKMAFDKITLVAKKLRIDGYLTQELSEDAAVNLGDEAANDIAETFAKKEDTDAFVGDGTSTYGGIVGLQRAFLNLGTVSNSIGIYDTAGTTNTYATITLSQILAWMAKLPAFADNPNTAIFCHKLFYHSVLQRVAAVGGGGTTMTEIVDGSRLAMFMGYPVEFVQALPQAPTADVPDAFFGDMTKCADFGDRRGMTFQTTDVGGNAWANDEIAYKASQRWDFQVHDIGNNTSTAANQVAGPVVALIVT